jgi:hydrogenase expression/formation protein HypD
MKYVDEFRDRYIIKRLAGEIRRAMEGRAAYRIMEVCGTHTMNIFRFGLKTLLPANITLVSGPGCPVCVTPNEYIDKAIWISRLKNCIITTFGDMLRVPGSRSSLEKERTAGRSIRIVYSTTDALSIAHRNPDREIVFLAVGFETTIPTVAQSIIAAKREGIRNFSVLCGHKTMPSALKAIAEDRSIDVDGFLLPGHVSAVTGSRPYGFLASRYGRACVIAGFEPADILQSILMLVRQKRPKVEIQYTRVIKRSGNAIAKKSIAAVFFKTLSLWRGIGIIKDSGLAIRPSFREFDAEARFAPASPKTKENRLCICGDVIRGVKSPPQCPLFGSICNPANPVGACMVSSEGTCGVYYKYNDK